MNIQKKTYEKAREPLWNPEGNEGEPKMLLLDGKPSPTFKPAESINYRGNEVMYQQGFNEHGNPYTIIFGYKASKQYTENEISNGCNAIDIAPISEKYKGERKEISDLISKKTKGPLNFLKSPKDNSNKGYTHNQIAQNPTDENSNWDPDTSYKQKIDSFISQLPYGFNTGEIHQSNKRFI